MKILVKYPCRERPVQFFKTLEGYMNLSTKHNIHYLVSLDSDDYKMNNPIVIQRINSYSNVTHYFGLSPNKVQAINRDMFKADDWNICVLASDDMICKCPAWDEILRNEMELNFPDTDGCLFHWDGDSATKKHNGGKGLCTMNIIGRKYFDRFSYLYHPSYQSLWCDNEFTEVAQSLNRMKFFDTVLFSHEHFSNNQSVKIDDLMKRNNKYYNVDRENFKKRKSINFGLKQVA